ncbi:hypothetical protein [Silvimonas amylolytica]|uniref:Uncharacterized protein n=1 Tax=Silvimonas amylolytica TaxID=449663 RepID=A0ABQ2PQL0_9NEIS|nr:hypothetical protein [Silvimonas amylolytica]GGP27904.1 hypothetical protein GCM10010971_37230 [Silvimonas amylolytica]
MPLFLVYWSGLLLAPAGGFVLWLRPRKQRWWVWALPSLVVGAAIAGGLSLTAPLANALVLVLAYCSYCGMTALLLRARPYVLRFLFVIAILPVIGGCLLATVGALGLGFIAADEEAAPGTSQWITPDIQCTGKQWGSAGSSAGYTVTLYQRYPVLPFLQRKLISISNVYGDVTPHPDATCENALVQFKNKSR